MSEHAHESNITGTGQSELRRLMGISHGDTTYKPFFKDTTPRRYSRSREVDVRHIKLELSFDIPERRLFGVASLSFSAIEEGVHTLALDACDMDLGSIGGDAGVADYSYDGKKLVLHFKKALTPDKVVTVRIPYTVTRPRAGMYFIAPDADYPNKPVEIWTQGQDEDARYWFPCFDYPNEKATTELIATVPADFVTLSNGKLLSVKKSGKDKVWHWRHDVPHVSYLVTFVTGNFVEIKDQWDGIPVTYYCHPGDEKRAKNSFGDTPRMVKFFSEKIGVRYPYAKYSQIPATDFIFGGMENTTATTQTADTLHDDRAHLDFSSNPLVSHELGHQWFGNLVTCRDWSHGWLNEGFTTYLECCWIQHERGDEEFQYYMLNEMESYLDEDRSSYRRPIVCNRYEEPIELFDRHLYEKGACVQHMLRHILGERLFWKALKYYTERHAQKCTITQDWANAIEDVTGRNLDEFFDQWLYGGGHPEFKLGYSYNSADRRVTLSLSQTQKPDGLTAIFKLPVRIALGGAGKSGKRGWREEHRCEIDQAECRFTFTVEHEPDYIGFDVGNWILKTLDLSALPEGMLIAQLHHDSDAISRVRAARELGKRATRRALEALAKTLETEKLWFVVAEAGKALAAIGSEPALMALTAHHAHKHPKARRRLVGALGEFKGSQVAADALVRIIEKGDASYFVEAEACEALGKTRDGRSLEVLTHVLKTRESHNEVIREACLNGLVQLEDQTALATIEGYTARGVSARVRRMAIDCLGRLGKFADKPRRHQLRALIERALEESDFFVSLYAMRALVALGETDAIGALRRKERVAVDGRVKARARAAIEALSATPEVAAQTKKLRDEMDDIRRKNVELMTRLEALEVSKGASRQGGSKKVKALKARR